jgi:hypothetical protein
LEVTVPKRAFPIALAVLASPAIFFGAPSAAQGPTSQAWTNCVLREDLPGGAQLMYTSVAGPGIAARPGVTWTSGHAGRISLMLNYGRGPVSAPSRAHAFYYLGAEPQSTAYKVVFDYKGAAQPATLSLGPGVGESLTGEFDARRDASLTEGFARAQRVTATVYEGDQQISQSTFELAPDRREAGLEAFARRVQANEPSVCRAASSPPLPVPPIPHR